MPSAASLALASSAAIASWDAHEISTDVLRSIGPSPSSLISRSPPIFGLARGQRPRQVTMFQDEAW